jgi:excisionase family DNA binding protein
VRGTDVALDGELAKSFIANCARYTEGLLNEQELRECLGPRRAAVGATRGEYSIRDSSLIACAGRTSIYEAIKSGALRTVKRGRRTLILADDLHQWVQSLPAINAKSERRGKQQ